MKSYLLSARAMLLIGSVGMFFLMCPAVGQTSNVPTAVDSKPSTLPAKPVHPNSAVKTNAARHHSAKTPTADAAPSVPGVTAFDEPEKTIIRNGGARDLRLQLTPTMTDEQAAKQRRQTRDLLAISNENLKRIAQSRLDDNQQDMLQEVHNYMEQARLADKAGELQRAQTLASKARQLSDDLAGVRTFLKLWPW